MPNYKPSKQTLAWFREVELRVFMRDVWPVLVRNVLTAVAIAAVESRADRGGEKTPAIDVHVIEWLSALAQYPDHGPDPFADMDHTQLFMACHDLAAALAARCEIGEPPYHEG